MSKLAKTLPKISILGDSLSMPRPGDGVPIDDTYPVLLANERSHIILNNSVRSIDSSYFLESKPLHDAIRYANSEYFVLHVGICDCSPRLFTNKEKFYLNTFSELSTFTRRIVTKYISFRSQYRMYHTKKRQITNVSKDDFKRNILNILSEIKNSNPIKKIILVNIIYPGDTLASKSFGIRDLVEEYNLVLNEIHKNDDQTDLIDLHTFSKGNESIILPDGHHYDSTGHAFIYNQIKRVLTSHDR